jgi:pyruvate carboxylase
MIADRKNQVRVRANIAGYVEVLVRPGQIVHRGQCVIEVEGDGTIERLAALKRSTVLEVKVASDDQVEAGHLCVVLQELPGDDD